MSEYFERNCQALAKEKANQLILERVRQTEPATNIDVFETGDGSLGIAYEGIVLHSITGAVQEAKQIVQEYCKPRKPHQRGLYLLFGLGLGYVLAETSAATKQYPDSMIMVFEPSLPLLRFVLENVDIAKYAEERHLIINNDPYEFYRLIQENYVWKKTELDMLILPSTTERAADQLRYILKHIPELIESQQFTLQAGLTLSEAWVTHFIKLLPYWPKTYHFETLDRITPNKPAIVVSAGPSLDKALDDLKRLQDNMIIIAVGRSLRPLLNAGIKPDFIAFLDYEGQFAQLQNLPCSTEDAYFVIGPYTEEAVLKTPNRGCFLANMKKYPLAPWADAILGTTHIPVDILGTVSYLGLQTAYTLGCNPIILLGQDLAFTKDSQYAKGALNSNQRVEDGYLISEESPSHVGAKINIIEVQGQQGETLLTTRDYLLFQKTLTSFAFENKRLTPERKLFNASVGGMHIEGFENKTLSDIFNDLEITLDATEKQRLLEGIAPPLDSTICNTQFKKLADGVQTLIGNVEAMQRCIEQNLRMLKKGVISPSNWNSVFNQYIPVKQELQRLIQVDLLISLVMGKPSYLLNESIKRDATNWEEQKENLTYTIKFLESCQSIFTGDFYQTLKQTHQRLIEETEESSPVLSSP